MRFPKLKYIFWDNDGVLVDTEKLYFQATKQIMEKEGFSLSREMFVQNILKQSRGVWFLLEEKGYSQEKIDKLRIERNNLYDSFLREDCLLVPGIRETLEILSDKFSMAIVTSSRRNHFTTIHERTGILKYFEFFLTREDYTNSKPDPEPYLAALKRSGILPVEAVVIEDSERGLNAALAAGLECLIVQTELSEGCKFEGANAILNSPDDLIDYLLKEQ